MPIYDKIIQFFQQYPAFKNANVREKFPADLQQRIYSIQVAPVYGEVLNYQRIRPICLFLERLGFKCGDEERLYFTFTFTPIQRWAYNVKCLFDGKLKKKVGQQVKYVVFDKKFDKYLEDYGSKLMTALRQYLK